MPRFSTLDEWLSWQESLHPRKIDLGLDRVSRVAGRMLPGKPAPCVITVAGTNGKGSSCALLESIYLRAGYRVGKYTSPHLFRYNERIVVNGVMASDDAICAAFQRVDEARAAETLSYFEFGTLAAFSHFAGQALDIALLEVGMGGRLDAVNCVDPDVALVTAVGLDHVDWLGEDRETIGREKAGIFRPGIPAVCSDPEPPQSVRLAAEAVRADWYAPGESFDYEPGDEDWCWRRAGGGQTRLPLPGLPGEHQLQNAAGVLMVVDLLQQLYPVDTAAIESGLQQVVLPARCQFDPGVVEKVFDVAHNADSAATLRRCLESRPVKGRTRVVLAMLADKDVAAFVQQLAPVVDEWLAAGLPGERGQAAAGIAAVIGEVSGHTPVAAYPSVTGAYRQAVEVSAQGDRVVVCGSFLSVAEIMGTPV